MEYAVGLMSLKSWLMPAFSQRLLSRKRLLGQRERAEKARLRRGEPHLLHYFHQTDDPYSALVAACLPALAARYKLHIQAHLVGPPPDNAAPERDKLIAYSRKDAALLAQRHSLMFRDTGAQPDPANIEQAQALLVAAIEQQHFIANAPAISAALWSDPKALASLSAASHEAPDASGVAAHLKAGQALRQRLGHYLGGMFYYGGEWYWGIDRLHHLERRLQDLGAQAPGVTGLMFPPDLDLTASTTQQTRATRPAPPAPPAIDFYVSLRSPYSAIVTERVFELGRRTGAPVNIRYVLPMVMRGLPVPLAKRYYISLDTAREAFVRGIAFGRLNDPVGRPTERGLALLAFAMRAGQGERFLVSFMRGVWAEGIDAGSDRGLRRIAERAGLNWPQARAALKDPGWRKTAEENRQTMFGLGLWGVPSFCAGDTAVWGQDRLWAIEDSLTKADA
jgi:2-hydroxychromene-2-carboxylate isomerase